MRIMRLMAYVARHSGIVILGSNLRKSDGLREIPFVTFHAEYLRVQFGRNYCAWIIRVTLQRAVARFAGNTFVFSGSLQRDNFWMARFTQLTAGKCHGASSNNVERIGPEVAILAKTLWY